MEKGNSKYQIYLKALGQWTEVTEDYYYSYYRPIWCTRKKMQKIGRCWCPKNLFHLCDGVCYDCEFYKRKTLSLDMAVADDNFDLADTISDSSESIEEDLADLTLLKMLYQEIDNLPELDKKICHLVLAGETDSNIARILKLKHSSNVLYHKKKAFRILREKLADFR